MEDVFLDEKTVKNRLKENFSDQVVFSSRMGGVTYVCFSNNLYDIAWRNRNIARTIEEEENDLIDSAAELICRKIRATIYNLNEYLASDQTLSNVNENIPPKLMRFLNHVIYKDKEQTAANEKWFSRRILSIVHAIIALLVQKVFFSSSTYCRCHTIGNLDLNELWIFHTNLDFLAVMLKSNLRNLCCTSRKSISRKSISSNRRR